MDKRASFNTLNFKNVTGEIVHLTTWMRLIFEVSDLNHASPATVSRYGLSNNDRCALYSLKLLGTTYFNCDF
jgi:hypothetical protein